MNLLKKIRSFAVFVIIFSFLSAASLSSCEKKANQDSTEHPAEDDKKADHPKADSTEHPKKDSTQQQ